MSVSGEEKKRAYGSALPVRVITFIVSSIVYLYLSELHAGPLNIEQMVEGDYPVPSYLADI